MKPAIILIFLVLACTSDGRRAQRCGGDRCRRDEECLEVVASDCFDATCERKDACITKQDARKSCEETNKDCKPKEVCLNVQLDCFGDPCPIRATCLPLRGGGGGGDEDNCGFLTCNRREDCIMVYECLEPGCREKFYCLPEGADSCENGHIRCEYGTTCVMVEEGFNRLPQPQCKPDDTSVIKPGICPKFPPPTVGKTCRDDEDCNIPGHKCCQLVGQRLPTCEQAILDGNKPGFCPSSSFGFGGRYDPLKHCDNDSECPLSQKCCKEGRFKVCKQPLNAP